MIASDGAWDGGKTHPRSAGTNSRALGRYVREEGVLPLKEAIRKMSLAPAQHLERRVPMMRNKGRIRFGAHADLVVFDPATVIDRATYRESTLPHGHRSGRRQRGTCGASWPNSRWCVSRAIHPRPMALKPTESAPVFAVVIIGTHLYVPVPPQTLRSH